MVKYPVVIVDDERMHQEVLLRMFDSSFPDYQVMAVCSSVEDGMKGIKEHRPKLVFLDVMMPPKTGFDLLNEIGNIFFDIIFTTSFEKFAIQAFKVSAVDYLLKPFGEIELREALQKFEKKSAGSDSLNHIQLLLQNLSTKNAENTRIALPTLTGFVFVMSNEIIRCEGDGQYTKFHLLNLKPILVSKLIKDCEELLRDFGFVRAHQSHIINLRCVKEYLKGDGGTIIMTDNSHIELSRHRKELFLSLLQKL